jgi:hypothetical protein
MTYQVITSMDLTLLIQLVNDMLSQSWQCQGGLQVSGTGKARVYYQAMIKGSK